MADKPAPSPMASDGKDELGRFLPGHKFGKGNPHAKRVQQIRSAMLSAVKVADVREIVKTLIKAARAGDIQAAKLVLDRTLGPPPSLEHEDRLARLESLVGEFTHEHSGQTAKP